MVKGLRHTARPLGPLLLSAALLVACGSSSSSGPSRSSDDEPDGAPPSANPSSPPPLGALDADVSARVDARPPGVDAPALPLDAEPFAPPDGAAPDAPGSDARARDGNPYDLSLHDVMPTGGWKECGPFPQGAKFLSTGAFVPLSVKPLVSLLIGAGPAGVDPLPADLDEVRFYKRVLTPQEIAAHAQKKYEPCTAETGCGARFDFDKIENGAFADTGPDAVAAKVQGAVKVVDGVVGGSARFDGKGWLEVPHHESLAFTQTFTFSGWVRRSGTCPPESTKKCEMMRIFEKGSSWRLDMHAGAHRFENSAWIFHGVGWANPGTWMHLAVTFDHQAGIFFYKDGKLSKACPL